MSTELYILDLIGTFAFGVGGAYIGLKKHFDLFGIVVCAVCTAVGGGTLRELLFNNTPFYFHDPNYAFIICIAIGVVLLFQTYIHKYYILVEYLDAIGLVTFAFIGASVAHEHGLGYIGIMTCSVLSSAGGGIIRDVLIREEPAIFSSNVYATIAIILGLLFAATTSFIDNYIWVGTILFVCFIFRVYVIHTGIHLWKPKVVIT